MKKLLQKVSLLLLPIMFLLPSGYAVAVVTGADGEALPSINVANIVLDKNDYSAGEDIKGTFILENHSGFALHNLSFRIQIASDYEELAPDTKFAKSFLDASPRSGSFDLGVDERQTIPFTYRIPSFINGQKLGVGVDIFSEAGNFIAFGDSEYISIKSAGPAVEIKNAELLLSDGAKYNLTEGPTIYKDKEPKGAVVEVSLTNNQKTAVSVVPQVLAYEQKNIKNKESKAGVPVTLAGGESKTLQVALPTMSYKPGVYFAEISLLNNEGKQLASLIGARYIVGGNIATIHSALVDKSALVQNEEFNFAATLSGRPFDIALLRDENVAELGSDAVGKIVSKIYNERDEEVASFTDDFYVSGETYIEDKLYAGAPSTALRLEMEVFDDAGALLISYKENLSDDYDLKAEEARKAGPQTSQSAILWAIGSVILLIIIIVALIKKKKSTATLAIFLIVMATLALSADDALAKAKKKKRSNNVGCSPAAVSVKPTAPYRNQNFAPDAVFSTTGVVTYTSCDNSATVVSVAVTGPKGDIIKNPSAFVTGAIGGHGWTGGRRGSFAMGPFTAPTAPGTYNVHFQVHSQAGICGTNASADVPIVVVGGGSGGGPPGGGGGGCPAGTTYCDGQCAASCGASNPLYKPFKANPAIPAAEDRVKLKTLKITPPLINKGASCVVSWDEAFDSYDGLTICRFTAPNIDLQFQPGSTTAPTSTSILNIQKDTAVKMECGQTDGLTASTTAEGVCRLNWAYVEVN